MKHIGIVGVTASGTALCYRKIVEYAYNLSGFPTVHPEISVHNYSFNSYFELGPDLKNNWSGVHDKIIQSINKLKSSGADFVIIPANTVHFQFNNLLNASPLPILSIIDASVEECVSNNVKSAVVLGTELTIQGKLYEKYLLKNGIESIEVPDRLEKCINSIIINDLLSGNHQPKILGEIVNSLNNIESDAVILACTELPFVLNSENIKAIVVDSTSILAKKALNHALSNE